MSQLSNRSIVGTFLILLIGALIVLGLWYLRPQPERRPPPKPSMPIVDVVQAQLQSYQTRVITQGTVEPKHQINVVAQVAGQVKNVSDKFVRGGAFDPEEVLVTLDDSDYQFALVTAQSRVASARRELALERGQARQAKRVWRDLGSQEANALSLREPQVEAATAALAAAQAELNQAKLNVSRTQIRVPFSGRIVSTAASTGQFVPAGAIIANVFDTAAAEIRLPLSDDQLVLLGIPIGVDIAPEKRPQVTLFARIGERRYEWPAVVLRSESQLDSRTRLLHLIAEVPEPLSLERYQQALPMGLFVEAELKGREIPDAVLLPRKALNGDTVWRVDKEKTITAVPVTVIAQEDDQLWLKGDIQEGDPIVVSDPRVLSAGIRVQTQIKQ